MIEWMKNRVSESTVARILEVVGTTVNRRDQPLPTDPCGDYDFWFDGGAAKVETGCILYDLDDGTEVRVGAPIPVLSITISLADGRLVRIQQHEKANSI